MAGSDHSSVKVVLTAVFANFFVTIAKIIGWFISLSPSMLAEAIHSFADTSNQLLIYIGIRSSRGGPTKEHPFGKGQSRYLWNLISAAGIFAALDFVKRPAGHASFTRKRGGLAQSVVQYV